MNCGRYFHCVNSVPIFLYLLLKVHFSQWVGGLFSSECNSEPVWKQATLWIIAIIMFIEDQKTAFLYLLNYNY